MDPEVIVGQLRQVGLGEKSRWLNYENRPNLNPKRVSLAAACAEMAVYWNCTPENARESLLKHGYASSPKRDWRVVDRGCNEDQQW